MARQKITFADEETRPNLSEADLVKLFFVRKDISDLSAADRAALLQKVNSFGLVAIRHDTIHLLLCLMHEARLIDQPRFLNEVFLPWCGLKRRTADHRRRIGDELARLAEFPEGSREEAMHVANLYRNIVSDLFDPYLTLAVACFQFLEAKFTDIQAADLGNGERTKYEYLLSRVKKIYGGGKTFLSGYDPRVRNAISHSGTNGVTYREGEVVFKEISRGAEVSVSTVEWSFDELCTRTLELLECVQSLDICAEIFGLDCTDTLQDSYESFRLACLHALTAEQRAGIRAFHEERLERLRTAEDVSWGDRFKYLTATLFANCGERGMAALTVKVSVEQKLLGVVVPAAPFDAAKDDELAAKAHPLLRYAVLARAVYGTMFDKFLVETADEPAGTPRLAVLTTGAELDAYADERAGLLDLVNDSAWFLAGKRFGFEVNFQSVAAAEAASPNEPFPRKNGRLH